MNYTGNSSHELPLGARRPFERGPRNCIGQELATLEARIVVAVLARHYDLTKLGFGEIELDAVGEPILNARGQYEVKSEPYPVSRTPFLAGFM